MEPPARPAASAGNGTPMAAPVAALAGDLAALLGADRVTDEEWACRAASTDFAFLSPILSGRLPTRPADLVTYPQSPDEIVRAMRLAFRHRVPLTPRGQGTGNYGQAVPLAAGLVLDVSRCTRVLDVGAGWAQVEAGASFVAIEAAARAHGQEVALMPTTVGSTIGGFLAGGAGGIGSVEHGFIGDGFVSALEVVPCTPDAEPLAVAGAECRPYLHAYGVTGVLATATIRLVPRRDWVAVLASFAAEPDATAAGLAVMRLEPPPRLVSVDEPALVATYPADPAMPGGRFSVRAVVDRSAVAATGAVVSRHGGRVDDVRPEGAGHLTSLAFNHVTLRARRSRPELCHLQLAGEPLVTRPDEVRAVLPGAMLHLDGMLLRPGGRQFGGLLLCPFPGVEPLYAGVDRLRAMGVGVVDPHTWLLGGPALAEIRATARRNDPLGLLNPGKLPA